MVNDKQITDKLINMIILSSRRNHSVNVVAVKKHEVYISFQTSRTVFLGLSASATRSQKTPVSFPLNDALIVSPPFANRSRWQKLISLDGCKKYCIVGWWWSENYTYLFKACVLKIFFIKNINSYQNRRILKWNIDKGTMLTVTRRIDKCPEGMGTLGIDWAIKHI